MQYTRLQWINKYSNKTSHKIKRQYIHKLPTLFEHWSILSFKKYHIISKIYDINKYK